VTDWPRDRIEHVVVLMLENRSFDHLFGFMDFGPDSPPLVPDDHPNQNPIGDPVTPSPDGRYLVHTDPPHSFRGIQTAINDGAMDGFVKAYYDKAAGEEADVVLHSWRLFFAGLALVALLVAPIGMTPRFFQLWGPVVVGLLAAAGVALIRWPSEIMGEQMRRRAAGYLPLAVLAIVVGIAVPAVTLWYPLFPVAWGTLLAVLLAIGIQRARRSLGSSETPLSDACLKVDTPMRCMKPAKIPVLSALASDFAVCTNWYSSVPGETWPNRNFVHAGTSDGDVNIEIGLYGSPTVFDLLDERWGEAANNWRIYYDGGVPQVAVFRNLWQGRRAGNWHLFRDPDGGFAQTVAENQLPKYAFIEPKHFGRGTNSQHPGNNTMVDHEQGDCPPASDGDWESTDFGRAEQLVAEIYETLRSNYEVFKKTMLLITYDENGGLFDRESPPVTTAPRMWPRDWTQLLRRFFLERPGSTFDFMRLGVRVPAIVISPWIRHSTDPTVYDHVSVIATLREIFELKAETKQDRPAASFAHLIGRSDTPRREEELPDLSEYVRAETHLVELADEGEPTVEGFAAQLARLGDLIVEELPATENVGLLQADPRMTDDPQMEFVQRFSANSAARRAEGS